MNPSKRKGTAFETAVVEERRLGRRELRELRESLEAGPATLFDATSSGACECV